MWMRGAVVLRDLDHDCSFSDCNAGNWPNRHGGLTPNVPKLAILKHDKLLPFSNLVQAADGAVAKVLDDVGVGFEDADVIADLVGQTQQLGGGGDIGADTEVGALDVDQAEEVVGDWGEAGVFGAFAVGLGEGGMAGGNGGRGRGGVEVGKVGWHDGGRVQGEVERGSSSVLGQERDR